MIQVRTATSIFANREESSWVQAAGEPLACYLPDWVDESSVVRVDGWLIARHLWDTYEPPDGALVTVVRSPQVTGLLVAAGVSVAVATIVGVVVNIGLAIAAAYLARKLAGSPKESQRIDSPTYSWGGIQTTTRQGQPIPIVYGEHRISGHVIGITTDSISGSGPVDRSILRMLLGCGEGPFQEIAGEARDRNGLTGSAIDEGVRYNGNPVANLPKTQMSVRLGNSAQSIIPGFGDLEVTTSVGTTLEQGSTVDATTSGEVDGFRVQWLFPSGLFYTTDDGKFRALSIEIKVRWKVSGSTDWVEEESVILTAAQSGQFRHQFRKDLPDGYKGQTITVQCEKISDFPEPRFQDTVQWESLIEISDGEGLAYPFNGLVAFEIEASAQISGGTPTFTFPVKGKKVWVWDGVDEDDPNFTYEHTTNPAWCLLDLLLNKRYGNGWAYNLCNIDLQSFKDWADYCDEEIDDLSGTATNMKRWEVGLVLDTQQPFWDQVNAIAATGRAAVVKVGDRIKIKIDRASSPVAIFTMGNIIADTLSVEYGSVAKRPSEVSIQFLNEDQEYVHDVATEPDDSVLSEARPERRQEYVSIFGITKKARALRAARYIVNQNRLLDMTATFEAGPDSLTVEPGDVIGIQHEMIDWDSSVGGRLRSAASTTVTLDRDITVTAGQEWVIQVRTDGTGSDVIQERKLVVNPGTITAGTAIDINTAWDGGDTPEQYDPYAVAPATSPVRLFKVVERELGQNLRVRFTCVKYDANVYDDTPTSGLENEDPDEPIDENTIPPAPTQLLLEEQAAADGSTAIYASWTKEPHPFDYTCKVYLRESGETNFVSVGTTAGASMLIEEVDAGTTYVVAVNSVAPTGAQRAAGEDAVGVITLDGTPDLPSNMGDSEGEQNDTVVTLSWDEITDSIQYYEVRRGSSWINGTVLGTPAAPPFETTNWAVGAEKFYIRALSNGGRYSGKPAVVSLTLVNPDGHSTDLSRDEVSLGWPGTKSSTQVDGDGNLELTAAATSGTYTSPTIDLGSIASRRVGIRPAVTGAKTSRTWASLSRTWADATDTWADSNNTWASLSKTWESVESENFDWQDDIYDQGTTFLLESRRSDDGSTWSAWTTHVPGTRSFRYLEFRITLGRDDATDYAIDVTELELTVSS